MNAMNKAANRVVLIVAGAVLLCVGVASTVFGLAAGGQRHWFAQVQGIVVDMLSGLGEWRLSWAGGGTVPGAATAGTLAALLFAIVLLIFLCTRRSGRTKNVLSIPSATGRTTVEANVAEAVLAEPLNARSDVISARANAYLVRQQRAIALAITVRRGASLPRVLAAAESVVRDWDDVLGERLPILIHFSDRGWRDGLRARTRVQ